MTALFVLDAPRQAFFEWLPLLRGVHPAGQNTIVAVEPELFASARWALPAAHLRPLGSTLRGPIPQTSDIRALFRNFENGALNPVCVLDGTGSYTFDHVRAHLVDAFRLHVLLADADGRLPVENPAPAAVPVRGVIDFERVGDCLGLQPCFNPPIAAGDDHDFQPGECPPLTCVLVFGPRAFVTQSGREAIACLQRVIADSGHRAVKVVLADLSCGHTPSHVAPDDKDSPQTVTEFELIRMLRNAACLFTNDAVAIHLGAAVGVPMLGFSAGLAWRDHLPRADAASFLGTDIALGQARDAFIAGASSEIIAAAALQLLEGKLQGGSQQSLSPSARDGQEIIAFLSRRSPTPELKASICSPIFTSPWDALPLPAHPQLRD